MHKADLKHSNNKLEQKLEEIFQLRRTRSKINWDRSQYLGLLEKLGNPHKSLPPTIHVAGTNGKGSIIAILRAILEAQGLKVHVYTSPHLIHINERIALAGEVIDNLYLEQLIDQTLSHNKDAPLSFFEITTALAFKAFSDTPADILLLEVGMGGKLDCTNVIDNPIATIINRISLDHTDFLSDDITQIAAEKSGIMKANVPCITGYQGEKSAKEIIATIKGNAKSSGAVLHMNGNDWDVKEENNQMLFSYNGKEHTFPLPSLVGAHQIQNAGVAIATLFSIQDKIKISNDAIKTGLKSVTWQGRLQKIQAHNFNISNQTQIWLDSGHNDSAAEALATQIEKWKTQENKPVHLIMGMIDTKDSSKFLKPIIKHISSLNIVPISSEQGSKTENDISIDLNNLPLTTHNDFITAIKTISKQRPASIILITGSVYLAGAVLKYIDDCNK